MDLEIADFQRCSGCEGVCMWRRLPSLGRARFAGHASMPVGTSVLVSLPQRYVLLSALLLHGLPWAALLAGGLLGVVVTGTDMGCLLGAVIGIGMSVLITPGLRHRLERATMRQFMVQPLR